MKGRISAMPLGAHVDRARARGAIELVPGDRVEIAADLGTFTGMCTAAWLPSTSTGTPRAWAPSVIAFTSTTVPSTFETLGDRHQFRARGDRVEHRLRVERAVGVHLDPFQHHALAFAQEMPGHDVGVMLHHAQHDLVAGLHPRHRPAIGHHVDALGGAGVQHDLVLAAGAEEARDGAAHRLVFLGGEVREVMQAAVDVGIFLAHRRGSPRRSPPAASAPRRRCRDRPAACR